MGWGMLSSGMILGWRMLLNAPRCAAHPRCLPLAPLCAAGRRRLQGSSQVCIRPLNVDSTGWDWLDSVLPDDFGGLAVHCYVESGSYSTAFSGDGVHSETDPDYAQRQCVAIGASQAALAAASDALKASGNWDAADYDWNDHNCCHFVEAVLAAAGESSGIEALFPGYSLPPDLGPL